MTEYKKENIPFLSILEDPFPYLNDISEITKNFTDIQRKGLIASFKKRIVEEESDPDGKNQFTIASLKEAILKLQSSGDTITIIISELDQVKGEIRNGVDGKISLITETTSNRKHGKTKDIVRFIGSIDNAVRIDGDTMGIRFHLNGVEYIESLDNTIKVFRSKFSLTQSDTKDLTTVLTHYIRREVEQNKVMLHATSPITVIDGVITVNIPKSDKCETDLKILREYYPNSTHPVAFGAVMSWCLVAPLHYYLKKDSQKGVQTPQVVLSGVPRSGKSPLSYLFIEKGYLQSKDDYFYPHSRIRTWFTFIKKLQRNNLPALFDDLPLDWFEKHGEELKSYVQTHHFGDLGTQSQEENNYWGMRSFIATINQNFRIDANLALGLRLLILFFTAENAKRVDRKNWLKMFDSVSQGFMFEIFYEIFNGKRLQDVLSDVEKFEKAEDWINYGLREINNLCDKYSIPPFPFFEQSETQSPQISNAWEIAEAFIAEYQRIQSGKNEFMDSDGTFHVATGYRSPLEGEFLVQDIEDRTHISFTGSAFHKLISYSRLKVPYKNATDFLTNINSDNNGVRVENNGKPKNKRIRPSPENPKSVFEISIPIVKEDE